MIQKVMENDKATGGSSSASPFRPLPLGVQNLRYAVEESSVAAGSEEEAVGKNLTAL